MRPRPCGPGYMHLLELLHYAVKVRFNEAQAMRPGIPLAASNSTARSSGLQ